MDCSFDGISDCNRTTNFTKYSSMLSSRIVIVSVLTFRFMINFLVHFLCRELGKDLN